MTLQFNSFFFLRVLLKLIWGKIVLGMIFVENILIFVKTHYLCRNCEKLGFLSHLREIFCI